MNDALYIVDAAALEAFCAALRGHTWLALDTEFVREQTYYPQLCLIQVATPEHIACIDPLALPSLQPLLAILCAPHITKVAHAARQDIEVFYHLCGCTISPIFDTQYAATLLGHDRQIGYANLVQQLLGVTLEKSYTRVNWRHRPLAADWLAYAADDVRYLRQVYLQQHALLEARGLLPNLFKMGSALANPARYQPQPEQAWRRVSDYRRLRDPQSQAVLQALAAWREQQAMQQDCPRRWVLQDAPLLAMAQHPPSDLESLRQVRGITQTILRRHAATLLDLIASAIDSKHFPAAALPQRAD